jgi:hypothetical protein
MMSEVMLFPRLHQIGVRRIEGSPSVKKESTVASRMEAMANYISYAPSGGTRVTATQLSTLREAIREIAAASGFPEKGNAASRAAFDAACAAWLVEDGVVAGGEALRDDVWAFIACCVAPDICLWRFEGAHPERFRGGVRNTFQRLWLRAIALDRGSGSSDRWLLTRRLSEDALVQIIERPSIGSDPQIARSIGEVWVAIATRIGAARMEGVTREAIRAIRIANETVCFSALSENQRQQRFARYFDEAADRNQ